MDYGLMVKHGVPNAVASRLSPTELIQLKKAQNILAKGLVGVP